MDPDRLRIREGKNNKNRKKFLKSFKNAGCSFLRTECFSCSLDVLYGGRKISKLPFLIKKRFKKIIIPDPDPVCYTSRISDPGVKNAPDPGSATMPVNLPFFFNCPPKLNSTVYQIFPLSHMLKRKTTVAEYAYELSSHPVHIPTPPLILY